jgi:hypothetical protein
MGGGSSSRSNTSTGRCCWWVAADGRLWVWTGLAELAVEVLTLDRLGLTRFTGHVARPTQSHATRLTRSAG